jgi:hypothetical protein
MRSWKHIKCRYKLSKEEFYQLYYKQDGRCAISGEPISIEKVQGIRQAVVDHCHKTGKIRGLLCQNCNRALGKFKDSPDLLRKAAEYIEKHQQGTTNDES